MCNRQNMIASISYDYLIRGWLELLGSKHCDRIVDNIAQTIPMVLISHLIRVSDWLEERSQKKFANLRMEVRLPELSAAFYAVRENNFSAYMKKKSIYFFYTLPKPDSLLCLLWF